MNYFKQISLKHKNYINTILDDNKPYNATRDVAENFDASNLAQKITTTRLSPIKILKEAENKHLLKSILKIPGCTKKFGDSCSTSNTDEWEKVSKHVHFSGIEKKYDGGKKLTKRSHKKNSKNMKKLNSN